MHYPSCHVVMFSPNTHNRRDVRHTFNFFINWQVINIDEKFFIEVRQVAHTQRFLSILSSQSLTFTAVSSILSFKIFYDLFRNLASNILK